MIPAEEIHCRPTLRREHFAPSDFEWARAQGGAWLLVRASANLRNEIVDQLTQGLGDPASIQVEVLEVEQSPVWLVKVQIAKGANSK